MIPSGCFPAGSPAAPCAGSLVGGRAREALGWASAAELGWAPGPKGSSWQAGSAAERQLCPGAAPLHSAAGLGALPAETQCLKAGRSGSMPRAPCGRRLPSPAPGKCLAGGQCSRSSWRQEKPGVQAGVSRAVVQSRVPAVAQGLCGGAGPLPPARLSTQPARGAAQGAAGRSCGWKEPPRQGRVLLLVGGCCLGQPAPQHKQDVSKRILQEEGSERGFWLPSQIS